MLAMGRGWRVLPRIKRGAVVLVVALAASVVTALPAASDPTWEQWARLRMCESSDRYDINTGTGYYGAYQFDLPTWRSVGGTGKPHQASPAEQDYRALYLYRMRGWQPWECANKHFLNLREDADARSKVVPSYEDAAYIGGEGELPPLPDGTDVDTGPAEMPPWPGVVYAYGDCAVPLKDFQLRMNVFDLGYTFTGSGCYRDQTKRAVLALQRANGINDSGRLGPKTWRAAWEGKPPRP
ncbi:transglycosylase family protein [Haloechinothrix salitolerans]